jgi:hypothetical protein
MTQLSLELGRVTFLTDSARREWINRVRKKPMFKRNKNDVWPLPKLISDNDMKTLYAGQKYEDCQVKEKNKPIVIDDIKNLYI